MILGQDVVDWHGNILVSKNSKLKEKDIKKIFDMGIPGIHIMEDIELFVDRVMDDPVIAILENEIPSVNVSPVIEAEIEKTTIPDRSKVNLSESVKERVAEGVQYLYRDTDASGFTDTTRNITNDLMKAISDNDAIAVDISTLKISDEYTFKHSVDVATMSMIVAKTYGLSDALIYEIGIAGLLHDVGKSKIPNEILNKPGKLTDDEFSLIKQHSLYGYQILKDKHDLSNAIKLGVLQHHEKMNCKGYPMGVEAEKINLFARIISVADIYDALVTERPYKKPFSPRDAVEMLMSMTEELDIDVMKSFLGSVILYPVGTDVELSNGELARVIANTPEYVLRPKVMGLKSGKIYDLASIECASIIIK